jgi:hypothetical protein
LLVQLLIVEERVSIFGINFFLVGFVIKDLWRLVEPVGVDGGVGSAVLPINGIDYLQQLLEDRLLLQGGDVSFFGVPV